MLIHAVAKEIELRNPHLTFCLNNYQTVLIEAFKVQTEMFEMLLCSAAGNKQVIYIGITKCKSLDNVVDKTLECLSRVADTERHPHIFVQAKGSDNCRLKDVRWLDR